MPLAPQLSPKESLSESTAIRRLTSAASVARFGPALRTILQSCVNSDPATSSIGFHAPLSAADADEYWASLPRHLGSETPTMHLFVLTARPATSSSSPSRGFDIDPALIVPSTGTDQSTEKMKDDEAEVLLATVQIHLIPKATHAHRGEVAKLLVHPCARRLGLAKRIMGALERFARKELGLEMLTLGTARETGAREFYAREGWWEWGLCPAYANFADRRRAECSFFVKFLREEENGC